MAKRPQAYAVRRKDGESVYFSADRGEVLEVEAIIVGGKGANVLAIKDGRRFDHVDWCAHAADLWRQMRRDGRLKP